MSTAIDRETTRQIDNDYIITYIQRRYFLPFFFASLSLLRIPFHIAVYWYSKERRYIGKKGEGRNGQWAHVCILQLAIRGTLELVHALGEFPRLTSGG